MGTYNMLLREGEDRFLVLLGTPARTTSYWIEVRPVEITHPEYCRVVPFQLRGKSKVMVLGDVTLSRKSHPLPTGSMGRTLIPSDFNLIGKCFNGDYLAFAEETTDSALEKRRVTRLYKLNTQKIPRRNGTLCALPPKFNSGSVHL